MSGLSEIVLGFMPLLDSAVLVAASQLGFAEEEGISIRLVREISWANIRDRVAVGHFDGAHMLSPMPIAFNLGLQPISTPIVAPLALGLGGNAITVSNALYDLMAGRGEIDILAPFTAGHALQNVIKANMTRRLKLAVVHSHSSQVYELRYWLSACGIDPDRDLDIVVVPPPLMPDALRSGAVDGFCVGEPWNAVAAIDKIGKIVAVKAALWKSSPDKVLGLAARFAEQRSEDMACLARAIYKAARWCADPANVDELATLLSRSSWLGMDARYISPALTGAIFDGIATHRIADFFLPYQRSAIFPWRSHALWLYSQMVRWGHASHTREHAEIAGATFRPDILRQALAQLGADLPDVDYRVEEAPVGVHKLENGKPYPREPRGFFDGRVFDPQQLENYILESNPPPFGG